MLRKEFSISIDIKMWETVESPVQHLFHDKSTFSRSETDIVEVSNIAIHWSERYHC